VPPHYAQDFAQVGQVWYLHCQTGCSQFVVLFDHAVTHAKTVGQFGNFGG